MNDLIVKDFSLTSMEVAEMVEKEHKYLMRDIKRYSNQMVGAKISPTSFWNDDTYNDSQGKARPCYLITKKGCEFIAHKMTGTKGTVFTARYINRFHEMESYIKHQAPVPELEQKAGYLITTTKCPAANPFYTTYHDEIEEVCRNKKWTKKQLFHKIMSELSKQYDLVGATRIYRKEMKRRPTYSSDIIGYFPELYEASRVILEEIMSS